MSFHDVQFPLDISFGSTGGPERRTEIVTLANGREERNALWADSRRRYEAGYGIKSLDDIASIVDFFEARCGRLHAFRWRDWSDWKSCPPLQTLKATDQFLGIGDGIKTLFPLIKRYQSGNQFWDRTITHPIKSSVVIAFDGDIIESANYAIEEAGVVFTTPPSNGINITSGFWFDVLVRFDVDNLSINLSGFNAGDIPSIPLIEVRA